MLRSIDMTEVYDMKLTHKCKLIIFTYKCNIIKKKTRSVNNCSTQVTSNSFF